MNGHSASMSMPDLGSSLPVSAATSAPTDGSMGINNNRQPPPSFAGIDNPMPHRLPEGENAAPLEVIGTTASDKLIIIMVGLPATGKTHIAKRICRFLSFFHDIPSQIFNVGDYRRQLCGANMPAEFYDPNNAEGAAERHMACDAALADLVEYVKKDGVRVAAFDATNSTRDRRQHILKILKDAGLGAKKMFVESICDQDTVSDTTKVRKMLCHIISLCVSHNSMTIFPSYYFLCIASLIAYYTII
jgi:predicted kinase